MDYVKWSSVAPAKAWGLYGTKGVIAPGAHADIAIVDMNRAGVLSQRQAAEHQQDLALERPRGAWAIRCTRCCAAAS